MGEISCFVSENLSAQLQSCWLTVNRLNCTNKNMKNVCVYHDMMPTKMDIMGEQPKIDLFYGFLFM